MRRPSGVTSWVCRVQNGQLSSQPGPGHDTLADIGILRPDLHGGSEQGRVAALGEGQCSNSSPSIEDLVTAASVAAVRLRLEKCAANSAEAEADPGMADPEL